MQKFDGKEGLSPVECPGPIIRKHSSMAITISKELQAFVSRGIASGRFRSEDEAVHEALKLLRDREDKLEALRADLPVGVDELNLGQVSELDIEAVKARGRARL